MLLALIPALAAGGQETAEPLRFSDRVTVQWVLVPVVVRSPKGYVKGLQKKDFRLLVDGEPVPLGSLEAGADAPVSAVFLQDLSGSMANGGKIERSARFYEALLDRTRPGDELTLVTFGSGRVEVQIPRSSDVFALRRARHQWAPHGTTALHDAVAWLPELSLESGNAKRVALLVTDGADNASALSAGEARTLVRRAELPVYILGLETGSPFALDAEGKKRFRYADVLNLLAHQTGGRYLPLDHRQDPRQQCTEILADLRHQYVLGFQIRGGVDERYRQIRVEVDGRRRRVSFRRGYSGGPPIGGGP